MLPADVPAACQLSDDAFYEEDLRRLSRDAPPPQRRAPQHAQSWTRRAGRFLASDPGGCWVAEEGGALAGLATSIRRERLWILSTFAVRPGLQGRGTGRALLEHAQRHAAGCDRWLVAATDSPQALRRYHVMGFALYPQMLFDGEASRAAIPAVTGLRDGSPADLPWMEDLDRDVRGASHGPDHPALAAENRLIAAGRGGGYAYLGRDRPVLLAARDEDTARALLWECLASLSGPMVMMHVTSANMWAADVALRARLTLRQHGFLGVRGMAPPAPYIHSGPLL
jgi:GNAT superfamily N-acetyltransferase